MPDQQSSMVFRYGTVIICLIAGVWTVFHLIWDLSGQTADHYWGPALLVPIVLALVLAFMRYLQERPGQVTTMPHHQFPEPAITCFFFGSAGSAVRWFVLRMNVGTAWFAAGWEKATGPTTCPHAATCTPPRLLAIRRASL